MYHHKYLLCCYARNGTSPKKIIPLEGYTVDYSETIYGVEGIVLYLKNYFNYILYLIIPMAGHHDGQAQFVMVKEANKIHFGVKGSNERLNWLQSLTRATGQSHKPCPPDSTPNNEGWLQFM